MPRTACRFGRAGRHAPILRVRRAQSAPVPDPVRLAPSLPPFLPPPPSPASSSSSLTHLSPCARSNHIPLRPTSAAAWIRTQLATSLRSRKPYSVNLLLAGFDPTTSTPSLYWVDYLGTLGHVPYAAHGYGAYFATSTMDRWHDPEADLEQGLDLLRKCIAELETRFIMNLGGWTIRGASLLLLPSYVRRC